MSPDPMLSPSLTDALLRIRSDCSVVESIGQAHLSALTVKWLPTLEAFASGAAAVPARYVGPSSGTDRLLTVAELASRMGTSTDHIYRHAGEWPFTRRVGARALRFSEQGLEFWLRKQKKQG